MRQNKNQKINLKKIFTLAIFLGGFFVWPNFVQATTGDVIINEIAWMGTTALASDEWLELFNTTSQTIDLTGWGLFEAGGDTLIISLAGQISSQGYYLIERSDDDTVFDILADAKGPFSGNGLSNNGEYLILKNAAGETIDSINAPSGWPAGSASTQASMERKPDGTWQDNDGITINGHDAKNNPIIGTPRAANSSATTEPTPPPSEPAATPPPSTPSAPAATTPAPTATAVIKINEVYPNPKEDEQEFIELCNKGESSASLSSWKLADTKKVINLPEVILVSRECKSFDAKTTKITLNNSNETIYLYNPSGEVADKLAYASSSKGQSLSWDEAQNKFLWSAKPTPGRSNEISKINEPPLARITFDYNPAAPNEEIIISAEESSDPDDDLLQFSWQIGESFQAAGMRFNYRFSSLGSHLVKLTASDGQHATMATSSIDILPAEEILSKRSAAKAPAATTNKTASTTPTIITAKKQTASSSKTTSTIQPSSSDPHSAFAEATADEPTLSDNLIDVDLANIRELELGSFVRVQGTVAVEPGVLAKTYFYVTGSPGIQVYFSKKDWPKMALGDVVGILGELTETGGELRLKVAAKQDIVPLYKSQPPTPTEAETGEIGEELEGALIKASGELTEKTGTSWIIDDGSGETKITFQTTAKIKKPTVKAGEWVEIIGLVGETKSGYRVLPRYSSDVRVLAEEEATEKTGTVLGKATTNSDALARFRIPANNEPQTILKYLLITSIALIVLLAGLLIKFRIETKKRLAEMQK